MKNELTDMQTTEVFQRAVPPLNPQVRDRAVQAMANSAPARAHPRRRLIAITVGVAAVVLFGLGFVPFPAGSAKGALARAQAGMLNAGTFHMVAMGWVEGMEYRFETWASQEGLYREDRWENGSLNTSDMTWPEGHLSYVAAVGKADEHDSPHMPPRLVWSRNMSDRAGLEKLFAFLRDILAGTVTERRVKTLWGGERDVVIAEATVNRSSVISGIPYLRAGKVRVVAEIAPDTGRLISLEEYSLNRDSSELKYRTESVEWDVEIPEDTWTFNPPSGTTLHRYRWWTDRQDKLLATGNTANWQVNVHTIDVNRSGDLVVTLSRWLLQPDVQELSSSPSPSVHVEDSASVEYVQEPSFTCVNWVSEKQTGGYWTTTLRRDRSAEPTQAPRSVSLTIHPYSYAPYQAEAVTFRNLPLPPRQQADDLFKASEEVIQY